MICDIQRSKQSCQEGGGRCCGAGGAWGRQWVLQGSSRTCSSLKHLLKSPWLPSQCWEHLEGGAEPGFPQLCSTSLRENAKALDDAPFSEMEQERADGWD